MQKNYGYRYFSTQRKKSIFKKISLINGLLLILQMSFGSLFFIALPTTTLADDGNMCQADVNVVLVMDRSGSMDYTSRCDWWQLQCNNPPSCSTGYTWVQNTTYNQTQSWCTAKNQSHPHESVYLAINPKKIVAAKQAADNFVGLMGINDQSALVSFATNASLDKLLSNNHISTQTAVDGLITGGATDIGDAIKLGTQELKSSRANPQAVKAMILLTDGLANKPNGPGYGEYAADVTYAQTKAAEAASSSIKIFTIGLGDNGEINETMLINIASTTGAQYYHSPTQNDLQTIYNSIASRLCQYGSISGCKYNDSNNDGIITGEEKIPDWEIKLNNDDNLTQPTDQDGCYKFSGLLPGSYTISEGGKTGVTSEQTYPAAGGSYTINLAEGEIVIDKDFGNYLPICGNNIKDSGEECDAGPTGSATCSAECKTLIQCTDSDNDGYNAEGGQCGPLDCADNNPAINPGAVEICDNKDNNCDGQIDENLTRATTCGKGACAGNTGSETCTAGNWAGDTCDAFHGASQEVCDSVDNDCNSLVDENISAVPTSCGIGACAATGQMVCSYGQMVNTCQPGTPGTETCDGQQDENCDGAVDEGCACTNNDTKQCGSNIGLCTYGTQTCAQGIWGNCTGGVASVNEICDNLDNNCDGSVDENFTDLNNACTNGVGACAVQDVKICSQDGSGTVCNAVPGSPAVEICDGLDNDCDGQVDEDIAATATSCGQGACASSGQQTCQAGTLVDLCQAGTPAATEICGNIIDDNCNGQVDEGCGVLPICGDSSCNGSETCSTCSQDCGTCPIIPICGNTIVESGEQCDNGTANGTTCTAGYGLTCQYCTTTCQTATITGPTCGDNIKNGTEQCDGLDGVGANQSCSAQCTLINLPYCGDGACNGTETCTSCSSDCGTCGGGQTAFCGNSIIESPEQCDNGLTNGVSCTAGYGLTCQYCSSVCQITTVTGAKCGDNIKNGSEQCDGSDGVTSGFTCNSQCALVANQTGGGSGGSGGPDGGMLTNSAATSGGIVTGGTGATSGATSPVTNTVTSTPIVLGLSGAPQLVIEKSVGNNKNTGLDFYNPGDKNVPFTVIITNNGNLTAINTVLSDILPKGFIYSDNGLTAKIWNLGDIKPGEFKNINYAVDIAASVVDGKYTNTSTVKADNNDPVTATAEVSVKKVKVAGAELAGTGFTPTEFYKLLFVLLVILLIIAELKTKYLKTTKKKLNLLKKTLIFDQDLFTYQRAGDYYKNR